MALTTDERAQSGRGSRLLIAFLLLVPLVIGVAFAFFWRLVPAPLCGNEILADAPAPDGAHRAVVFRRHCGATTPFSTNVSILRGSDALPDDAGNLLVLRDVHDVAVEWTDAAHVVVRYPRGADAFLEARRIDGIEATLAPR
jgi:hypothetical protein